MFEFVFRGYLVPLVKDLSDKRCLLVLAAIIYHARWVAVFYQVSVFCWIAIYQEIEIVFNGCRY